MAWFYLLVAGLFECVWAVGLKYTEGFSKPMPSVITVMAMVASVWLLALAMKDIPIGTAYAVWTGIGAVGVAVVGMLLFDESRELLRLISLMLIITGIVGLKLVSGSGTP
ncbi:quaternary ammonium compound efflux SMR transporter SugE [Marinicella gelatinilytica]|uniref:quaternary ammonium compound efflux SMR transporter SugE n=1 Tax=Marinicella gelatinilytica TaxID=2996017 RepID=UPI002260A1E2|nr:quaternary ammonium compound efflux SMR transporter SugE [Marinicella gelatinilytica]MCX7544880.1 quaternary ammonium compound efflux SMR transporter SugE [Marinicella gelatinilytica]